MNISRLVLLILFLVLNTQLVLNAQIAINEDGSNPDASAMLDVTSSDKGILIPRMTTSERTTISSPATGLLVYDTDENSFWYYNSSAWNEVGGGAFISENDITHSNNNDDDFVFGADSLDYGTGTETKLFFDKSKGAFRAGTITGTSWNESNIGNYSFAAGYDAAASGNSAVALGFNSYAISTGSVSIGYFTSAANKFSIALGSNSTALGDYSTVLGVSSTASGDYSTAIGSDNDASGDYSTTLGLENEAFSYGETTLGLFNTTYTPSSASSFDSNDRLFVIGNGTSTSNRSDALIVYKNGNTEINGDLTISGTITGNNTSFISENDITHSNNNDDDFVFGADSLNYGSGSESKFFFDKSNGAFRAGGIIGTNWDKDSIGSYSFGAGYNVVANGDYSTSLGYRTAANGDLSTSLGYQTTASGTVSTCFGGNTIASGPASTSFGGETTASGSYSTSFGRSTIARGSYATSFGLYTDAVSYGETAIGFYNTTYSPNSTYELYDDDRLFVIGNGTSTSSRSDALIVYKSGDTEINGALTIDSTYTFPTTDGDSSQVLITDGNGALTWGNSNSDALADADNDTKIQVEESSDEDIIRFDLGGTEFMRLNNGRVEVVNTGNSIFIGEGAGENDDFSDNKNVFVGYQAGISNTDGDYNVFTGNNAGHANISGRYNLYNGHRTGYNMTTGHFNSFIGALSGFNSTTGGQNTYIGYRAGYSNEIGSGNVCVGYRAGDSETGSNKLYIDNSSETSPLIYGDFDTNILEFNGDVGVGTTPSNAKFEVSGSGDALASYTYGYLNSSGSTGTWTNAPVYSIYADNKIAGFSFHAHSDERIKNIQGISNAQKDLNTLMNIEITDYTLKDKISNGNQMAKKVIAQQVKSVYPQAVSTNTTEVIPDIYQTATINKDGWINLQTDLKVGEKVKIIFDDRKELLEVLETKENAFRVRFITKQQSAIFVYGRQVSDFHTVDYEAISMLNVSATQQLAKENEDLRQQVENLKTQISEIHNLKTIVQQLQAQLGNQ